MKIIWSPLAVRRMKEAADYIAKGSTSQADKWVESIFNKMDLLKDNPEMGRIVPEIEVLNVREILFGKYRLIYKLLKKEILILTVRSFRQIFNVHELGRVNKR